MRNRVLARERKPLDQRPADLMLPSVLHVTRVWRFIPERGKHLHVGTLLDGQTLRTRQDGEAHAFPDRSFRPPLPESP